MQTAGSSTFTMTNTNRDVAVHDLPRTLRWLNAAFDRWLLPTVRAAFGDAAGGAYVYRSLVVQYDAAARLTHQPIHRDGALITDYTNRYYVIHRCATDSRELQFRRLGRMWAPPGSLISMIIALNDPARYSGGGTHIEPLGRDVVVDEGCALIHPSALRHAGARITAGERNE